VVVVRCGLVDLLYILHQVWKVYSRMLYFLVVPVTHVLLVFQVLPIFSNLKSIFYKMLSE
jgi:hypothetical protein